MPHDRRHQPRESDERAKTALSIRACIDDLEAGVQHAILSAVEDTRLDPDVLEAMNRLVLMRRELWENLGEYFAALRVELEAMIEEDRKVAVSVPVPERFARR